MPVETNAFSYYATRGWVITHSSGFGVGDKMACILEQSKCPTAFLVDDACKASIIIKPRRCRLLRESLDSTKSSVLNQRLDLGIRRVHNLNTYLNRDCNRKKWEKRSQIVLVTTYPGCQDAAATCHCFLSKIRYQHHAEWRLWRVHQGSLESW